MIKTTTFKTMVELTNGEQVEREFRITQMPAIPLLKWVGRGVQVLINAGMLDSLADKNPQQALAQVSGFVSNFDVKVLHSLASINADNFFELFQEALACAEIIVGGNIFKLDERTANDQLDPMAVLKVGAECIKVNLRFFTQGNLLGSQGSPVAEDSEEATNKSKQKTSIRLSAKS